MAGILFTNGRLLLAGYKPYKGHITGIGGKQKDGEQLFRTAIRETIEELFGLREIPSILMEVVESAVKPTRAVFNKGFTQYFCTFDDLGILLVLARLYTNGTSPYYAEFPTTLQELLLDRINTEGAEIAQLVLIPYEADVRIARHLLGDLT